MRLAPKYNLWHNNNLIIEEATFDEILDEMAVRGYHKRDVDIEQIDSDTMSYRNYNNEPELNTDR